MNIYKSDVNSFEDLKHIACVKFNNETYITYQKHILNNKFCVSILACVFL